MGVMVRCSSDYSDSMPVINQIYSEIRRGVLEQPKDPPLCYMYIIKTNLCIHSATYTEYEVAILTKVGNLSHLLPVSAHQLASLLLHCPALSVPDILDSKDDHSQLLPLQATLSPSSQQCNSSVVRMKYLWSTKVAKHMVLEVKGNFSSCLATKGEEYVDLGPVVHIVTHPLVRTIWPVSHVN